MLRPQPNRGLLPEAASGEPNVRATGPGRTVRSPGPLSRPSPSANLAGMGKGDPLGARVRHPRSPRVEYRPVPFGWAARRFTASRCGEPSARMKNESAKCPECGAESLHRTTTNSGGGYGPVLLPGLERPISWGTFFSGTFAQLTVVVCAECGLTRFYADAEARAKLPQATGWLPI